MIGQITEYVAVFQREIVQFNAVADSPVIWLYALGEMLDGARSRLEVMFWLRTHGRVKVPAR